MAELELHFGWFGLPNSRRKPSTAIAVPVIIALPAFSFKDSGSLQLHVRVCRHYFDMSPQSWSSKDVGAFHNRTEFDYYVQDNSVTCVFAIGALHTHKILKGSSESGAD